MILIRAVWLHIKDILYSVGWYEEKPLERVCCVFISDTTILHQLQRL